MNRSRIFCLSDNAFISGVAFPTARVVMRVPPGAGKNSLLKPRNPARISVIGPLPPGNRLAPGAGWQAAEVEDLFELLRIFNTDRDWAVPGALTSPGLVRSRADRGQLDAKKRQLLRDQLGRVQEMAARYRQAKRGGTKDLQRIAQWLADQWTPEYAALLHS